MTVKPKSQPATLPTTPTPDPKLTSLETRISDLESRLARALADYSNLEKRYERESGSIVKFANLNLLTRLLEVRDHLGLAAAHGDQSLKLILGSFDKILVDEGVTEVKTDGDYDPTHMECQDVVPGIKNKVISVIRRGYLLGDRTLRPARVTVGSGEALKSN